MKILGIETSCDETAVAVVENGKKILFHLIASQAEHHAQYGGVFPEMASRQHIDRILPLVEEAKKVVKRFDAIAVANGPGLMGSLLMGTAAAQTLAYSWKLPLIGVNHVDAHLYAAMMGENAKLLFPALGVVVSGGHTFLAKILSVQNYIVIGTTVDDAVGEAFDKVATLLGYPYPGGPHIESLAQKGDPEAYPFKAGTVKNRPFDFSYSGLKTNVLYTVKGKNGRRSSEDVISEKEKKDVAASFQKAALLDIVEKSLKAAQTFSFEAIYLGGGVTNSQALKDMFDEKSPPIPLYFPPKGLSLDNAAMIAGLAYHLPKKKPLNIKVFPKIDFIPKQIQNLEFYQSCRKG